MEFNEAAEFLEDEKRNAAGDLFVDAGIAAADVICCVRLGEHSNSTNHSEAIALLAKADAGIAKHLTTLLGLKNKVAYDHHTLSSRECLKMKRAAAHLVERAKLVAAAAGTA
ncbi:hypothetical protein [Tsukamurella pseudospumae]|uniref:hypothetical protein n=1 Tax=Tsukamurella pseudospumae TaxID=239498 RepID=UPI0031407C3E